MKYLILLILISLLGGCFDDIKHHYVVKPIVSVVCGMNVVETNALVIRENKEKFITQKYNLYYKNRCSYSETGGRTGFNYYTEENEGFAESIWNDEETN